jgi:GH15 family glucan-1,4-alpha-glucosidase
VERFKETADTIRDEIERDGYNHALQSYTRELKGSDLDASLLTLALVEYCHPASDRMVTTAEQIYKHLSKNNLIYRYRDLDNGLGSDEGSFVVCSFWLAENLAKSGKLEDAIEVFEAILQHASPVGLLSEEIDPDSHELLGNYPQGFSHIGLINAALSINKASEYGAK